MKRKLKIILPILLATTISTTPVLAIGHASHASHHVSSHASSHVSSHASSHSTSKSSSGGGGFKSGSFSKTQPKSHVNNSSSHSHTTVNNHTTVVHNHNHSSSHFWRNWAIWNMFSHNSNHTTVINTNGETVEAPQNNFPGYLLIKIILGFCGVIIIIKLFSKIFNSDRR